MYQIALNNIVTLFGSKNGLLIINDKENYQSKRERSVKNHIKAGDYFGTLATILDLTGQTMKNLERDIKNAEQTNAENIKILKGLKNDLMFLHKKYRIDKKANKE